MATSVGDLAINISTNIASLEVGMRRANEIATRTANQISSAFSAAQATLAGLGVGLSLGALVAGLKSVIDYADKLNDLSKSTGIAVETLGGLGYAAKTAGVDLETVAKGTQNLARAMADAAGGNAQLTDLFQRMGVQIKDTTGALRPLDDVLFDVASKFQSYADGPEKAALATELFRKGGQALIPLLDEGGEKLRALVEEYQRYGGITSDTAARADAFNDSLEKIKLIQGSLLRQTASELLPALQATANVFLDIKEKGDGVSVVSTVIVGAFKAIAVAAIGVYTAFQALGKSLGGILAAFTQAIQGNYKGALEALKAGFSDAATAVSTGWERAASIVSASTATIANKAETNIGKARAPIKETGKAVEELVFSLQKLLKPFDDMAKALGKTGAELEAQLSSLRSYGVELKASSVITAEYELTEGKLADRFQVLSFLYPQVAEAVRHLILARAADNDAKTLAIELEKQYIDALRQSAERLAQSVTAVEDQVRAEQRRAQEIGKTRAEIVALDIAETEHAIALAQEAAVYTDVSVEVAGLTARLERLRELQGATINTDRMQAQFDDLRSMFGTLESVGRDIFNSIGDKGADMWTKIRDAGKKILLDFLYQLTLKPFLITIAASLTGVSGGAAANVLGGGSGGNPLSQIFGGGSGIGGSIGNLLFGAGSAGAAALGAGFSAGISTLGIAASAGVDAIGGVSAALGALGAVAGPLIPVLGLAIPLLGGLFDKKPSEVRGRFQIGGSGFEDNVSTPSRFGALGFSDADTAQFSGEAAQVFNKIVAGALDAFEQRFSAEQSDRLAGALQSTDFGSFEGTFTTQDFLQKYGGQVLQQVVAAAFDVLNPALGTVARNFRGTADEIAKFGNSLLAIDDATKGASEAFRASIATALGDATQETADKVLAFVTVVNQFGNSIAGLGTQLQALKPESITAFVDALGGAQSFFESFAFLQANFLTTAQRTEQATAQLTAAFEALGVAVPATHQAFLDLINAALQAGNIDLAASLQKLAPLFVQVNGTADQAAEALAHLGDSAGDAADAIEEAAKQIGVSVGSILKVSTDAAKLLLSQIADLAGESTGGFGDKLSIQIDLINDAIDSANRADFPSSLAFTSYIGKLRSSAQELTAELAQFTILSAQYDAQRAEQLVALQTWYNEQFHIFGGDTAFNKNVAALDALKTIFDQRWTAIVNGATAAAEAIDDFIRSIQSLADSTRGTAGQQAQLELALSSAKLASLQTQYAALDPTSALAKAILADINKIKTYNASLATQIEHFATYTAQYGSDAASRLVELENQFAIWRQQVGDNADALSVLQDIFDDQWQAIIDSLKGGVDGSLAELARLKQGIADYLKGLVVSDISPLSPAEKLAQAATAFNAELALAQKGDVKALGDITQFADTYLNLAREFYKSSQPFVDIFNAITQSLGNLAGTLPTGQPLLTSQEEVNAAIASALPDGKIASQADIDKVVVAAESIDNTVKLYLEALANSNTADAQSLKQALEQQQQALSDAAAATAK